VLLLLSDLGWVRLVESLLDFQGVVWVLLKKFLFFLLYSENIVVVDAVIVFLSGRLGLLKESAEDEPSLDPYQLTGPTNGFH